MSEGKVTVGTIADILNVSPITVSRALSGQPGVSDDLRERIIQTAKELGYKKIKTLDKANILLLIRHRYVSDNSNFSYMVQGIERYIKEYGAEFNMEFIEKEKQSDFVLPYNLSKGNRFDGVIILGKFDDDYIEFIRQKVKNVLVLNGYSYNVDCDYVYFNHNRIGYKAANYLIKKGHRSIGFIGAEGSFSKEQRFLGFCKAFEDNGIALNEAYVVNHKDDMLDSLELMIRKGDLPTAFICDSDNTALKLIKLLHDKGIDVPENVSVIGIGNTEMSSISIPSLTTFDLNIEWACEAAVRLLLNRMTNRERPYRTTYIDAFLVERQSVKDLHKEDKDDETL